MSASAAGRTSRRLGNTSTCPHMRKGTYGHELVLPSRHLVRPAADDDFVRLKWVSQFRVKVSIMQKLGNAKYNKIKKKKKKNFHI